MRTRTNDYLISQNPVGDGLETVGRKLNDCASPWALYTGMEGQYVGECESD